MNLKPCPFCGGEGRMEQHDDESLSSHNTATFYRVHCWCGVALDWVEADELEATEAWNTRAVEPTKDGDG